MPNPDAIGADFFGEEKCPVRPLNKGDFFKRSSQVAPSGGEDSSLASLAPHLPPNAGAGGTPSDCKRAREPAALRHADVEVISCLLGNEFISVGKGHQRFIGHERYWARLFEVL